MAQRLFANQMEVDAHNARVRQQRGLGESVPAVEQPALLARRSFTLILPWPPTLNHSVEGWYRGGRKTQEYKDFFQHTAMVVLSKRIKPLQGPLSVVIYAFPPDNRPRDLDNIIKPTLDAMQEAGCFDNDKAFDHIEIKRVRGEPRGAVLVGFSDTTRGTISLTVREL